MKGQTKGKAEKLKGQKEDSELKVKVKKNHHRQMSRERKEGAEYIGY